LDISSRIVPIALFAWIYSLIRERAHGIESSRLLLYHIEKSNFERGAVGVKSEKLRGGLAVPDPGWYSGLHEAGPFVGAQRNPRGSGVGFVVLGPLVEFDGAWYQAAAFCALVAC